MNIHYIGAEMVPTSVYRARTGDRKVSKAGTKPPRTRDNLTGKGVGKAQRHASILHLQRQFPGGKTYRRAMAWLELRQKGFTPTSKPSGHANTKPGSMAG